MRIGRVVVLGLCFAAGARVSPTAEAQGSAREIESLQFESSNGVVSVQIRTSVAIPVFRCFVNQASQREVVLEVPDVTSRLQNRYDLDGHLVQQARVEAGSGPRSVRVRFLLGDGALSGVEQSADGLILRFARLEALDGSTSDRDEYRIGIGDKLEITVFGHEDLNRTVDVRTDGSFSYPFIGDLKAVGKTPSEMDAEITAALGKDYLVDPQVGVEVKESQTRWVTILGEIRTPGRYLLKRSMHVIDLVAEAGGPTKDAGTSLIVTHREHPNADPQQIVVDRDRLFGSDNKDVNLLLGPGDIVTIGEKDVFYIRGEVVKPGPYFLEKEMTVLKAITFAGGFTQFANRKELVLLRTGGDKVQKKISVNVKAIEEGKAPDIALKSNDLIIVPRRVF
jgi:polysaccharide biosynthesis/export protein